MRLSGVLFDLDGTLLDTAPEFEYCLNTILKEEGQAPLPSHLIRTAVNNGAQGLIDLGFKLDSTHPEYESRYQMLKDRLLTLYIDQLGKHSVLFPGIANCLDELEKHNLPWGIVTNKIEQFTLPLIETVPHFKSAKIIVSGDTLEHAKPHPAPLEYACKHMSVKPGETLYVGDAQRDMEAALAAGMPCMLANYGYIDLNDNPHAWGAHCRIDHPDEIFKFIKSKLQS